MYVTEVLKSHIDVGVFVCLFFSILETSFVSDESLDLRYLGCALHRQVRQLSGHISRCPCSFSEERCVGYDIQATQATRVGPFSAVWKQKPSYVFDVIMSHEFYVFDIKFMGHRSLIEIFVSISFTRSVKLVSRRYSAFRSWGEWNSSCQFLNSKVLSSPHRLTSGRI